VNVTDHDDVISSDVCFAGDSLQQRLIPDQPTRKLISLPALEHLSCNATYHEIFIIYYIQ